MRSDVACDSACGACGGEGARGVAGSCVAVVGVVLNVVLVVVVDVVARVDAGGIRVRVTQVLVVIAFDGLDAVVAGVVAAGGSGPLHRVGAFALGLPAVTVGSAAALGPSHLRRIGRELSTSRTPHNPRRMRAYVDSDMSRSMCPSSGNGRCSRTPCSSTSSGSSWCRC